MTENGGVFVAKTRHLLLAGGTKVNNRLYFEDLQFNYLCIYCSNKLEPPLFPVSCQCLLASRVRHIRAVAANRLLDLAVEDEGEVACNETRSSLDRLFPSSSNEMIFAMSSCPSLR